MTEFFEILQITAIAPTTLLVRDTNGLHVIDMSQVLLNGSLHARVVKSINGTFVKLRHSPHIANDLLLLTSDSQFLSVSIKSDVLVRPVD